MKKIVLLLCFLPGLVFAQNGFRRHIAAASGLVQADTSTNVVQTKSENNALYYGQTFFPPIQFALTDSIRIITGDSVFIWQNWTGSSVTVDSIKLKAKTDDFLLVILEKDEDGKHGTVVDSVTASTNGTNMFYATETDILQAGIEAKHILGFLKPEGSTTWFQVVIFYHKSL